MRPEMQVERALSAPGGLVSYAQRFAANTPTPNSAIDLPQTSWAMTALVEDAEVARIIRVRVHATAAGHALEESNFAWSAVLHEVTFQMRLRAEAFAT